MQTSVNCWKFLKLVSYSVNCKVKRDRVERQKKVTRSHMLKRKPERVLTALVNGKSAAKLLSDKKNVQRSIEPQAMGGINTDGLNTKV